MLEAETLGDLVLLRDELRHASPVWACGRFEGKTRFAAAREAGVFRRPLISELRAKLERDKDFLVADYARAGVAVARAALLTAREESVSELEATLKAAGVSL